MCIYMCECAGLNQGGVRGVIGVLEPLPCPNFVPLDIVFRYEYVRFKVRPFIRFITPEFIFIHVEEGHHTFNFSFGTYPSEPTLM